MLEQRNDNSIINLVVNDSDKSINFFTSLLRKKSIEHDAYKHYTTLDSLDKIFHFSTFKLTRGVSQRLNDLHEPQTKGEIEAWNRTYMACFNYSEEENMAMWGLYGRPKTKGVCIVFPKETFKTLSQSTCKISDKGENIPPDCYEIFTTDVFYAKGNNDVMTVDPKIQTHIDTKIEFDLGEKKLFNHLKNELYTGCVKNYAWHYEDEVRIIVRLNGNYHGKIPEFIYLNILESCFKDFKIITGPNFTKKDELRKILAKREVNIKTVNSVLENSVNFKSIKDLTDPFVKKFTELIDTY